MQRRGAARETCMQCERKGPKHAGREIRKVITPLDRARLYASVLTDADRTRLKEALGFKDPTYNGWSNYETWAVALWIDNDQGTYNEARRMAREAAEEAAESADDLMAVPRTADGILADRLKEWITECAPDLGATMF